MPVSGDYEETGNLDNQYFFRSAELLFNRIKLRYGGWFNNRLGGLSRLNDCAALTDPSSSCFGCCKNGIAHNNSVKFGMPGEFFRTGKNTFRCSTALKLGVIANQVDLKTVSATGGIFD